MYVLYHKIGELTKRELEELSDFVLSSYIFRAKMSSFEAKKRFIYILNLKKFAVEAYELLVETFGVTFKVMNIMIY